MTPAISIQSVNKVYDNSFQALKNVDLEIHEGSFYALLGHNGAGKTTLIKLVAQLSNITSGDILIHGQSIKTAQLFAKRKIGLVPQEFNCNPFAAVEDILFNFGGFQGVKRKDVLERMPELLERLYLTGKRKTQCRFLSGGMKRCLMIARALVHQPDILFLDEPTAGVDIEIRQEMWDFLRHLNQQGMTIVLTTHYLEEAERLCNDMALINQGEIVARGPIKTLLANQEEALIELAVTEVAADAALPPYIKMINAQCLHCALPKNMSLHDVFDQLAPHCRVIRFEFLSSRLEQLMKQLTTRRRT